MGIFNFVSSSWVPFLDSFFVGIGRIDQWVRILRLAWEFWDFGTLSALLKPVGHVIKVDCNTLLRLKGKFARIYVNIYITKPLLGTLVVSFEGKSMKVPLIYEGTRSLCMVQFK